MKDIQQLIKKNSQEGRYEDIFPKTFIDAISDKESGETLTDILAMFNMLFLSYNGSRSQTRLQVPSSLRREGLWVTYVLYDKTVVTEWYSAEAIDDTSWEANSNWRDGSNSLVGDISISSDGYWVINGEITNIKAQGEAGITPILRVGSNNHLQVSYTNGSTYVDVSPNPVFTQFRVSNNKLEQSVDLGLTWTVASDYIAAWFKFTGTAGNSQADNVGKIQISRDNGVTWSDLSGEFTNSLHIKGYVATVGALPSTAVQGDIYGVGPTYDPSDTEHTNPIYQLYVKDGTGWVNNGRFTSISAGVVQDTGTSETEVMSQKASTLTSKVHSSVNKNFIKDFITLNEVVNTNGTITESSDWDTVVLPVRGNYSYNITNIPTTVIVGYCVFKKSLDPSSISYIGDGISSITQFTTPNDCNYIAIDFKKDTTITTKDTYNETFIEIIDKNTLYYPLHTNLLNIDILNSGYHNDTLISPYSSFKGYVDVNGNFVKLDPTNPSWDCKLYKPSSKFIRLKGSIPANTAFAFYTEEGYLSYYESYTIDTTVDYIIPCPNLDLYISSRTEAEEVTQIKVYSVDAFVDYYNRFEFIRCISPFVHYNSVMNKGGTITTGTLDWDYAVLPVKENTEYIIQNPLLVNYIVYFNDLPDTQTVIGSVDNNYGLSYGTFKTPFGCKWVALDFLKSGVSTNPAYYIESFLIEKTQDLSLIQGRGMNNIICVGDSITQGNYGRVVESYEYYLQKLLMNYSIINCGVGGENSLQIAARQGGVPMYIKENITLPALNTDKVNIGNSLLNSGLYSSVGYSTDSTALPMVSTSESSLEVGDTSRINPCYINGIECIFSSDSEGNQYLQRVDSSTSDTILPAKSIVYTKLMREFRNSSALILFAGTNDKFDSTSLDAYIQDLISTTKKMIEYSGCNNYIVVTQWSDIYRTLEQLIAIENALIGEFGSHVFNLRRYAITDAITDSGITPTQDDLDRIAQGLIPTSLTIDGLHPNATMYKCMANKFKQILIESGL